MFNLHFCNNYLFSIDEIFCSFTQAISPPRGSHAAGRARPISAQVKPKNTIITRSGSVDKLLQVTSARMVSHSSLFAFDLKKLICYNDCYKSPLPAQEKEQFSFSDK